MSLFFLTTIQEKTFATLSDEPQSVTELALLAKLPRTSVAKALTMLEKIGLAKGRKLREKNKHVYMRQDVDRIEQKIENFKESVLKEKKYRKKFAMAEESEIKVFSGKEAVFSVLTEIVETRKGERLYIYQGKDGPSSWIEFLGLEKVVAINKKLTENGLIAISVRSHKTKDEVSSRPKLHESYAERIMKTHPILDHFFEEKTSMYVSRGICIFVNLKTGFAFKIEDRLFSSTLIKMFELISESLKR